MANSSFFGTSGTTASVTNTIQTSVDAAATSATNAETAKTAAETAKSASETAQAASEAARNSAQGFRDTAETHKNDAQTAKTAAETAQAASENARDAASTSATNSATSESNAATSATNAANSATSAAASSTSAAASLASFQGQYSTGTTDPTTNLDEGDLFFNTTDDEFKVYNGSAWQLTIPSTSNQTNINTVAGIQSDVTAVAGKATEVGRLGTADAVADLALLGTTDAIADMNTLGTSANVANMSTLAGISSDVTAVAGRATEVGRLGTADAVADLALLGTADAVADMNTLGTSANVTNMNTLAGISSNITTAANNDTNISTVAARDSDIGTVAARDSDIGTVAARDTDIGTLAAISSDITGVNSISSAVTAVNSNASNINTVSSNSTNINSVNSNETNINTVAGQISPTNNISTVAGLNTEIGNLGPISANITTVANNISGVNSFAERYRTGATDPSADNDEGDLFYNTTSNALKVYTGSAWEQGVTAGSGFLPLTGGGLTGNLQLNNANLIFEGSTADANETTITATDPTADRTITLPDKTGTVVTVASDGTTGQLLRTDGSGNYSFVTVQTNLSGDSNPTLSGNLDVGTHDIVSSSNNDISLLPNGTGKVIADGNGSSGGISITDGLIEMRSGNSSPAQIDLYCEVSNAHKVSIKAPPHANYSGNVNFTLPAGNGTNGQFLQTDGSGNLSYATVAQPSNATTSTAGLMSAADKTKMDGIETGATADQTAAEIRTLVESATDSNVFTDADHTKLNGIETGATADQTITAGGGLSGGGTGNVTISHSDTSSQASVNGSGRTYIQDVTLDTYGHVTGLATATETATSANNATITLSAGGGMSGGGNFTTNQGSAETITISHADTSSQGSSNNSGRTYIQDITLDTYGHVTGIATATETVVNTDTNTTYTADGNRGLQLSGTVFGLEDDRRRNSTTTDVYSGNTHDFTFYDADVGIRWYTANAEEMRLENDGDLHVDGNITAYSTTVSDPRLKEDIQPVTDALAKVEKLNGYTFTYKHDGSHSAGVVSTEVADVLPSAIRKSKVPLVAGHDNETLYDIVQYDQLHALLIEAVKELSARVKELENGTTG